MRFYLGTHCPNWLADPSDEWPLFVSRIRLALRGRKGLRAVRPWALDSGGFTELSMNGRWTVTASDYVSEVRTWTESIGRLEWAAIQDWMCEPFVIAKTGLSVREHQQRTVASYLELTRLAPEVPWVPVLQGWFPDDYLDHVSQYRAAGIDLTALPLVGLGSVCRRQGTAEVENLIRQLTNTGIQLHGFGFKIKGLLRSGAFLKSADSLAWSYAARNAPPLLECKHRNCNSCYRFASQWRTRVVSLLN